MGTKHWMAAAMAEQARADRAFDDAAIYLDEVRSAFSRAVTKGVDTAVLAERLRVAEQNFAEATAIRNVAIKAASATWAAFAYVRQIEEREADARFASRFGTAAQ